MFSDTRIQQSSAVIAQAGVVGAVDTTKMAGQLLSRSSGDSKAPANLQRYHSPTSRRKDLNPPRKHYQSLKLEVEMFRRPKKGPPRPDPRKHLKVNGYGRTYIQADYKGAKTTRRSDPITKLTQARIDSTTNACGRDSLSSPVKIQWLPKGLGPRSQLSLDKAKNLIGQGALSFAGLTVQASHTSFRQTRLYATISVGAAENGIECLAKFQNAPTDMSLALTDRPGHRMPQDALEQPSMTDCFGLSPGTVTLNYHVSSFSRSLRPGAFRENVIQPLQTDSLLVLQRLHYLQGGLDADPEVAEEFLYMQLVHDPEWQKGELGGLERQVTVLVAALNNPVWTDFRDPNSQVLAEYFDSHDVELEERFYRQLLLSVELSLRIKAITERGEGPEEQSLISKIPEKVAWDLALAKVWQNKMTLEPVDNGFHSASVAFHVMALRKSNQKERLLEFARNMKWVRITEVEHMLGETPNGEIALESRSLYSASWITGLILPGLSASLLMMRSLIDCDADITNTPPGFDQMHSNLGFQYRGNTFWYWNSIVAKVLGACRGVTQDYGWVGPCLDSDDLDGFEAVLVRSQQPAQHISKSRVRSMSARSTALGPPAERYPVSEYVMPLPDLTNMVDCVRIQKLAFRTYSLPASDDEPETCTVAIFFAIDNDIIPIRLRYNVSFLCAPPCHGTHPLFWDFAYKTIKPDDLVWYQRSLNGISISPPTASNQTGPNTPRFNSSSSGSANKTAQDSENILVVEAFGVADNDVVARAWASHIGVSAVVANVHNTCMACAIRMAYAGAIPLVILNDGHENDE